MCGITGVISLNNHPINISYLKNMCDIISHRGPDDAGYFVAQGNHQNNFYWENFTDSSFKHISTSLPVIDSIEGQNRLRNKQWSIYFGHRRLSILDLTSAGHQPMGDKSKKIWITYNGEIYNFGELRKQLEKKYDFFSKTDTEVVINAYKEWGIDCIKKFNGMFAFALYDISREKIYLIRDRYGIKPLYYTILNNDTLAFASEIKSILEYKEFKPQIDHEALLEYFTFQNIFTDKTLHKDIKLLPAGNYLEIDLLTKKYNQNIYWDFDFSKPDKIRDKREYIEELDKLFKKAVTKQLMSDVEVGSYLSGGMDSGSITAVASQYLPYIKTFTVGFDLTSATGMELGFDERGKSEYMSYKFKTEHYEMVLKSGDMERCLSDFAYYLEEPRVGQSYPNYYAAKLAGKFVKVVLSGAGGDEIFGGYPWRYYRAVVNTDFEDYIEKYYFFWQRLIPNSQIQKVFAPIWNEVKNVWTREIFRDVFKKHAKKITSPEEYINHSLYFEAKTFLHGLLVVEDKLSMAHSLETRVPFLDNDLVNFAQKIPIDLKLGNLDKIIRINENEPGSKTIKYFNKTKDGKLILRNVMKKYIPNDIVNAIKQGFSSPDNSWFKGESIDFVKSKLLDNNANIYNYFDKDSTQKIIIEHLNGEQNRRLFIWSLLNFEEFLNIFGKGKFE